MTRFARISLAILLAASCAPVEEHPLPLPSKRFSDAEILARSGIFGVPFAPPLPTSLPGRPGVLVVEVPEKASHVAGETWTPIVVKVMDAGGDEIEGWAQVEVTVIVHGSSLLAGTSTREATHGVAVFSDLSYDRAEAITPDVHATGAYQGSVTDLSVTVEPNVASRLELNMPYKSSEAGQALSLSVTAFDAWDNQATGYAGKVTVHTLAPMSLLPAPMVFTPADQGSVTLHDAIELRTAGHWNVEVTDFQNDAIATSGRLIHVIPAAPDSLDVSGAPGATVAGEAFELEIKARDAYGNVASTSLEGITVTTTDPLAAVSSPALVSGTATLPVEFRTAGEQHIAIAGDWGKGEYEATVLVASAEAATVQFTVSPLVAYVGEGLAPAPRVVVHDAFGNTVTDSTAVTLSVVGGATPLNGVAVTKAVGGAATFTDVWFGAPAAGVQLRAATEGLEPVTCPPFDVFESVSSALEGLVVDGPTPQGLVLHGRGTTAENRLSGFSGQIADPGALCLDIDGNLYIGQEPVGTSNRPVIRLATDDEITASAASSYPVGLAIHATGLHSAGYGDLVGPWGSFDGGDDPVWASIPGADLRDLVMDGATGKVYVADSSANGGRIIEVDGETLETRLLLTPGDEAAVALHPETGDLYVVTRNDTDLWHIDTGSGDGEEATLIDAWDVSRVERIEFHRVADRTLLYAAVRSSGDAGIHRWSPEIGAGSLEAWATGMTDSPPVDLACGGMTGSDPLYVTTRQSSVLVFTCPELGEGVTDSIALAEPGNHVDLVAALVVQSGDRPADVAVDPTTGATILAAGLTDVPGPIRAITEDGVVTSAHELDDPDAVAVDSQGRVYVGSPGRIWRSEGVSSFGQPDDWSLWLDTEGADVDDLAIDADGGDIVWAAIGGGVVLRIDAEQHVDAVAIGDVLDGPATIAVDVTGDLFAIDDVGHLWRIDGQTLAAEYVTSFPGIHPGWQGHGRMAWSPHDGLLYLAARFDAPARDTIATWNPATGSLGEWVVVNAGAEAGGPFGVAVDPAEPCVVFTSPNSGEVHRVCECD